MAVHSVPQNVEADDQIIGFLSLKQLIFTVLGVGFAYLTYFFFANVHPIAAIIWLPFVLFFFTLGLYRRKDQPAEVFLVSALGFYLKPKIRIWSQDGYEERVKITAPVVVEKQYTKDFTGEEAMGRLTRLSLMMDSRGWASKRANDWQNPDLVVSAESNRLVDRQDVAQTQGIDTSRYTQPLDQYDDTSIVGQDFDQKIEQSTNAIREDALRQTIQNAQMYAEPQTPTSTVTTREEEQRAAAIIASSKQADTTSIHEKVILPPNEQQARAATTAIEPPSLADVAVAPEPTQEVDQSTPPATTVAPTQPPRPQIAQERNDIGVARETEDGSVEISLH